MIRTSERRSKPVKRDDYVELKTDSEFEDDEQETSSNEKEEVYATPAPRRVGRPRRYQSERTPVTKTKKKSKPAQYFSQEESEAIFEYILSRIRSQHPDRLGRVAKRRVELSTMEFWERCKRVVGGDREPIAYKTHFTHYARKLHEHSGLSLLDKADLYYALDIRVDKSMRQKLIQQYEVEFNQMGVITGSLLLHHWDLIHPDSEPDDEEVVGWTPGWVKFTEYDDGLMWQFIVDEINSGKYREVYTRIAWDDFKEKHLGYSKICRAAETYRGRYNRILLPNLWRMPFDIETKAALYYRLNCVVPIEFRHTLVEETGVKLDEEGFLVEYPNCPTHLVLQSREYNSIIGISSTNRLSTLKHPSTWADTLPYTPEEDKLIWQYILWRSRCNGRVQRIREKMSGWVFWKQFIDDCKIKRTWQSLSEHFMEDLRESIMDLNFDLKTKMELYFAISRPVEDDTLAEFETIAGVILNKGGIIRFAAGDDFLIGRKDYELNDTGVNNDAEEYAQRPELNTQNILNFMEQIAIEEEEKRVTFKRDFDKLSNCEKYPYLPKPVRPRKMASKRKQLMKAATTAKKQKTSTTPRVLPPIEPEPVAKQEPEIDYKFFFPDGDANDIPDPDAPLREFSPPRSSFLTAKPKLQRPIQKPAQMFAANMELPKQSMNQQNVVKTLYQSSPRFQPNALPRVVIPVLKRNPVIQNQTVKVFKPIRLVNAASTSVVMPETETKPTDLLSIPEESKPLDTLGRVTNNLSSTKPTVSRICPPRPVGSSLVVPKEEVKPTDIGFQFSEQEVKQEPSDEVPKVMISKAPAVSLPKPCVQSTAPPRRFIVKTRTTINDGSNVVKKTLVPVVPRQEVKPDPDDDGPPLLFPEVIKSEQFDYEKAQKEALARIRVTVNPQLKIKRIVQPVPYIPPSMRNFVREQKIRQKGRHVLSTPLVPPKPSPLHSPVPCSIPQKYLQSTEAKPNVLKQQIIEDAKINNQPEPSLRDFLKFLADKKTKDNEDQEKKLKPGNPSDSLIIPCTSSRPITKGIINQPGMQSITNPQNNQSQRTFEENRKAIEQIRRHEIAKRRLEDRIRKQAEEESKRQKEWINDTSSRFPFDTPNYAPKPAVVIGEQLQELMRQRTAIGGSNQNLVHHLNSAFNDMEISLKEFTNILSVSNDEMTEAQREKCLYDLMELSNEFKRGATRTLTPASPPKFKQ
uniref:SPK domain-containing protein n=1 Tax=Caenorhabditis tropicalis TaxID=1561998 RepID=A0A1I7TLH6_9PELO